MLAFFLIVLVLLVVARVCYDIFRLMVLSFISIGMFLIEHEEIRNFLTTTMTTFVIAFGIGTIIIG